MSDHVDVLVLGAGVGGYAAAVRAAQLGRSVAVVEERYWGGACLNVGCIPSKALLRNAELAHLFTHDRARFGITVEGTVRLDYAAAAERSRRVADGRVRGVNFLMRKNRITQVEGHGTFLDDHTVHVSGADGADRRLTFDHAIIDVGATPRLLPGTALSDRVVTYAEQILATELPAGIVIVGAGAIGVEFAYILRCYGVEVTLVEFADRILPLEDPDVSAELAKQFRRLGVTILTSTRVAAIDDTGPAVRVTVARDGHEEVIETGKVLQAIGFAQRIEGYGLDRTGVAVTDTGAIAVDGTCRTSVPHLFAVGDVTAKLMLAHTAEAMGIVAAETIAGAETMALDYAMIPRATYCQPQVLTANLREEDRDTTG